MDHDVISYRNLLQVHPLVSGLTSGPALAALAFRIGSASRPVTGRRLAAVVAIGVQALFELFDVCGEIGKLRFVLCPQRTEFTFVHVLQV